MRFVGGAILGGIVGAVLGFLLRPAAPLIGQLPIGVVLTRGAFLTAWMSSSNPRQSSPLTTCCSVQSLERFYSGWSQHRGNTIRRNAPVRFCQVTYTLASC